MPDYAVIKMFHATMAVLSAGGFLLRAYWMLTAHSYLNARLTKIAPHVIDSFLLLSAVVLLSQLGLWPWQLPFVAAKIVLLFIYIVSGSVALKRGKSKQSRTLALVIALTCLLGIFYLAIAKPVLWL